MNSFEMFQSRIKELREKKEMTQKEFSDIIGITQQTLSGYENGRTTPSLEAIVTIAKRCNVSIDWLCGLTDFPNANDEIVTYSDIIRFLYKLERTNLEVGVDYTAKFNDITNLYYKVGSIRFTNLEFVDFFEGWVKMKSHYDEAIIDDDVYKLWFEKEISKYNIPIRYIEDDI